MSSIRKIGVGMLGYAFMGKSHSHAFKSMPHFFYPPPAVPELIVIFGRTQNKVEEAAQNFGFRRHSTDWKATVADPEVQIIDNCLPNDMHPEPSILAIENGKHVICEKPLARNAKEAKAMYEVSKKHGVKTMVAFNYRFVPAVQLARNIVKSGVLGKIYHFRARYLQDWIVDPDFLLVWRLQKDSAGSGPLGDLGSHIVDLARFVIGEPVAISGITRTFIEERPLPAQPSRRGKVTVEDAFEATVEFANGAIGTLEASRFATGRKNYNNFEVNGEKGSLEFNLERLNELRFYDKAGEQKAIGGWTEILVTEKTQPYIERYWPSGHIIGWEHTFINEIYHFVNAIVNDGQIAPIGATFEDGYKNAVILDSILESASTGKRMVVSF